MIKIHFIGTCSGTEPMPNMHHTSTVLEVNGALYWIDAGECCVHTAHNMGLNIMNSEAIFISHPHIDHIGGLANLYFAIDKLIIREGRRLAKDNTLEGYFPDSEIFSMIKTVALSGRLNRSDLNFRLNEHTVCDGEILSDGRISVTAHHNNHIKGDGSNGVWHAFSYLVKTENKRILFSGDVKAPEELDALIGDGVDVLVMETGHHKVADVCSYAASHNVAALYFTHHGREILENRAEKEAFMKDFSARSGMNITLCHDALTVEI